MLAAIAATSGACLAAACGGDDTIVVVVDDGGSDATSVDGAPKVDAHGTYDAGTFDSGPHEFCGETCYDVADAVLTIPGVTEFKSHQNRCSDADIDGFMAACLEVDGGDGGVCESFLDTHPDCSACLLGKDTSADAAPSDAAPTWPAIEFVSGSSYFANVEGCLVGEADAGDTCGLAVSSRSFCLQSACSSCDDFGRDCCLSYASHDISGCPQDAASPVCLDVLDAATQSDASSCRTSDGGSRDQNVRLVAHVICGP